MSTPTSPFAPCLFTTADLVDEFGDRVEVCLTPFRQFGGHSQFHGPIRTIRTKEDNADIRALLHEPGSGHVLVVDGEGSLRTALLGDTLGASAVQNGWAGIVIFGAVRDSLQLKHLPIGIKALGTVPSKSAKRGGAEIDIPVHFGDITFSPGHWLYSDEDGLLVSSTRLIPANA